MKKRRLKKWVKVVINLLIAMIIISATKITMKPKTIVKTKEIEKPYFITIKEKQPIQVIEETTKEKETIFSNQVEQDIFNKSIELGLTKEQAILIISISRHETGNWTSQAFINKHNFGGIMCNQATQIKSYASYEEGLTDFILVLKNVYFNKGLNTIAEIGAKYCPVGAENDPNGLNKYWVGGVTTFYEEYLKIL